VATSTLFGSSVVAGRRASRAHQAADARLIPVATEVMVAATAAGAIQRVSTERAVGHRAVPTATETQAIRTLLAEDLRPGSLAPGASPARLPAPELPGIVAPAVDDPSWTPHTMPVPSYTLKASAKPGTARPISDEDLAAGTRAAEEAVDRRIAQREAEGRRSAADADPQPATATLDAILARRRRQSA
jgi:hypothetical protein